jgi:class 3 adenylate cyclase
LSSEGKSGPLAAVRGALIGVRMLVICVGAISIAIFAVKFGLDTFFVASSPIARSALAKFVRNMADPLISGLISGTRVNTRIAGLETMPLILAAVSFGLTLFIGAQLRKFIESIEITVQKREMALRRAQRKPVQELAFSSARKKNTLGRLFGGDKTRQEELLCAKQELEKFRKKLAFLSIDVVGSTKMKHGRDPLLTERLFREYRVLLEGILKQHRHKASSWTPDGIMACFLQAEMGCNTAKSLLRALPEFNRKKNPLDTPVQVRCGLHVGDLLFDENTPLELLSDRALDLTGHLQKAARANSLLVSSTVYEQLHDKSGFLTAPEDVDGYSVFEWSLEPRPVTTTVRKPAAVTATPTTPSLSQPAIGQAGGVPQRIGRYEVLAELGRGGMGVVYKARDTQIGRVVAIKMILTGNVSPEHLEAYKKRFFREAQTAGLMSHPGIVTIYDIAEHETGQPYLVMEFVEGTTLDKLLTPQSNGYAVERLPLQQSLDTIIQVCDALDCAHTRGVIHRDIKPANILYTVDGKAKLADFGIAKLEGSHLTQTGTIMGTPAFMSPEQFSGSAIDERSDLFSVGAVLYWMLTGEFPFPGNTITAVIYKLLHTDPTPPLELNSTLPQDVDIVISRCLAKRPDDRYTSARELAADLKAILERRSIERPGRARAVSESTSVGDTAI